MIEEAGPSLYRAYISHKNDKFYDVFVLSDCQDSNPTNLLNTCVSKLKSAFGSVIDGDNQISDIYKHEEIESILGVKVTKS